MEQTLPVSITELRALFPVTREYIYLNHAGVSAPSTGVRKAATAWFDGITEHGFRDEEEWEAQAESARNRFANLIGAEADEVTFVRNTSHGLSLVAEGLDWAPGDGVAVATELEYPSNIYPWQHLADRGVELQPVAVEGDGVTVEAVAAACTDATRLVAVSSAQYASGAVTDLEALGAFCREKDLLLCVDGIQSVGALPVDVHEAGIHFLSADSHKWMLGVPGIGALFVDREVIDRVRPVLVGWKSTTDGWNFDRAHFELLSDARKFEEGSPAYALICGFDAALGLLEQIGIEEIEARIRSLVERLATGLSSLGCTVGPAPAFRKHILTFTLPRGDLAELHEQMTEAGIVLSLRRNRIRVSPHVYNTEEEMDRVIRFVEEYLASTE